MATYQYILTDIKTGSTKTLEAFPADWSELTRNHTRSEIYHGVMPAYTGSQRFMNVGGESFDKGGYWFIKSIYDRDKIKGTLQVDKKRLNPYTKEYDDYSTSIVEMTKDSGFRINRKEKFIECQLTDNSTMQKFLAADEIDVNALSTEALDGSTVTDFINSPKLVEFKPIDIYLDAETVGDVSTSINNITINESFKTEYARTVSKNLLGDRLNDVGLTLYENTGSDDINATFSTEFNYTFRFTATALSATNQGTINARIIYVIRDSGGAIKSQNIYATYTKVFVDVVGTVIDTDLSGVLSVRPVTMAAGDYLEFYSEYTTTNMSNLRIDYVIDAEIDYYDISEKYDSIITDNVECFLTFEMATRILQLITGENNIFDSNVFGRTDSEFQTYVTNGNRAFLATTSTKAIRIFPEATITVNFRDWFKSIDRMDNIALWYDTDTGKVRIEEKAAVYKDSLTVNLGVVSNLVITPGTYRSDLSTGTQEKGTYEKLQGAQEYNIQSNHSQDYPTKDKLEFRVPYNIDSLTMEFARREQYESTGSTDVREDDKICIVEVNSSLETIQNDDLAIDFEGFTGIGDFYNGNYTPRTCLKNNINHVGNAIDFASDQVSINFRSNTKDLIITRDGVAENEPLIPVVQQDEPLFYPEVYECDFTVTYEQQQLIESDPHGYYRIESDDGEEFYIYADDIEINDFTGQGKLTGKLANTNR